MTETMSAVARPVPARPIGEATVLCASPARTDHSFLRSVVETLGYRLLSTFSVRETESRLPQSSPDLILCERNFADGTWHEILSLAGAVPVIVFSLHADEALWAEVLCLGGHDVLEKPLDGEEVRRAILSAERRIHQVSAA